MSRPPKPLPDELGTVFRTSDARREGVTQGRLGARDLEAPFRGVRARRPAAEAIEVEGDHHRTSRRQWERDLEKYASYAEAGWQVIRASVAQVRSGRALSLIGASLSHADQR